MGIHRTAKIFTHGGSQAVRLPKDFRFDAGEVRIRKDGDMVILEPLKPDWGSVWRRLDTLAQEAGEDFPDRLPQPPAGALLSFED